MEDQGRLPPHDIEAEALEFEVTKPLKILGKPFRKLNMPEGSVVATIIRGEDVFVPHGDSTIEYGDRVIVFVLPWAVASIEKIFS